MPCLSFPSSFDSKRNEVLQIRIGSVQEEGRNDSSFTGFPRGSVVKNPPANAGEAGMILWLGRCSGEEMTTHFSILAWEIPWTEEPGWLQSMWWQKLRLLFMTKCIYTHACTALVPRAASLEATSLQPAPPRR